MDRVEGRNPVWEALNGRRRVQRLLVARGARGPIIESILRVAQETGVPVEFLDRTRLDALSGSSRHQGVIAIVEPFPYATVDELLARAEEAGEPPFLLVCAGVQDPQNLGALLRTAEAAGVHGVIIPRRRSAQVTPAVVRAAAGAVEHLPVAQVTNLTRTLVSLKGRGLWVCGASTDAEQLYFQADLRGPLALVVGSEGRGIPRLVYEHCDFTVRIPMRGRVQSLNVSVAGALLMYEALRQRGGHNGTQVWKKA